MMSAEKYAGPFARRDITEQVIGEEVMLYDSIAEKIHVLNHSAYAVWTLCDGAHSPDDIHSVLAEKYPDAGFELIADVHAIIERFRDQGLLAEINDK
jgi:hypothetical protein